MKVLYKICLYIYEIKIKNFKHAIVPILLVTIDFVKKNSQSYILVYLFILCTQQPYNNYEMTFLNL
jgi:hypothetical protein